VKDGRSEQVLKRRSEGVKQRKRESAKKANTNENENEYRFSDPLPETMVTLSATYTVVSKVGQWGYL
jgi:hypothetical protein